MAVMCSGKFWGISNSVTFTLKKQKRKKITKEKKETQRSCTSQLGIHTSGLNPLVKAFMRLSVVPSSTPLQFSSTLNKACVAHEFGIN